mgnify:CR=1 FL=1
MTTVRSHATASLLLLVLWISPLVAEDARVFTQKPEIVPVEVVGAPKSQAKEPKKTARKPADKKLSFTIGPKARWIWGKKPAGANDRYYFRRTFEARTSQARIIVSCDNKFVLWINGKRILSGTDWASAGTSAIQQHLVPGKNLLEIEGRNNGGPAGLAVKLVYADANGKTGALVTDGSWQVAATRDSKETTKPAIVGTMGGSPWGNVFSGGGRLPTQKSLFQVQPGFQVERLYTVPKPTQGSWVCLVSDGQGRLLASDQGNKGIYQITPPKIGSGEPTQVRKLDLPITSAQGMLVAFGHLYFSVNGGPGSGFYRAVDTNNDGEWDKVEKLKVLAGGGEHGPHALRLSPDGKSIYLIAGNHTHPPAGLSVNHLPENWGEDLLLPRQWDARGHARGRLAPGGWIARTDPDGKTWSIYSAGYRNPYDMDFNVEGELFAYDADMEWDMGSPWYRPTRLCHVVSGSEFGWRSGTGKWPTWYADSLPPVVNIGPGSPVGVNFGTGTRFPERYQRAVYLCDWTFGTMYAIHLKPQGSSYVGVREEFVARAPLPLTDVAIGHDGAMYFTIGGRGAQSELYRVTYVGKESTKPAGPPRDDFVGLRKLRRSLEAFHGHQDPAAVQAALTHLGHADRHIRYAARIALESQPVASWQDAIFRLQNPTAIIHGVIALARQDNKSLRTRALKALGSMTFDRLTPDNQLALLRAYSLTFIRLGAPDQETAAPILVQLDRFFPSKDNRINRDLSQLLAYLNSPTVIDKTLALMKKPSPVVTQDLTRLLSRNRGYGGTIAKMLSNHPELQKIHYAFVLRTMRYGWTLEQRREYFKWLSDAGGRSGGASYAGFLKNIRSEALANVSDAEKSALAATVTPPAVKLETLPKPKGPGQAWTVDQVVAAAESGLSDRNFASGRRTYQAARCGACHRFDGAGGATGPDLSNVAGRFSVKDLAESLVTPSKVISDQYKASTVVTTEGKVINGRIVNDNKGTLTIVTDPFDASKVVTVPAGKVDEVTPSKTSLMPDKLLHPLGRNELLDLIAYLLSRGNPDDRVFGEE